MIKASQPTHTILVLGASYAGLSTTHYLLKHAVPSLPNHRIILVGTSTQVMCRPACPRAMISDDFFNQSKLFVDIATQLEKYSKEQVTFINGVATYIDHKKRTAFIKRSEDSEDVSIDFHALVIATGASTSSPLLSNGPDRRDAWKTFRTSLPSARNIVIAGGGPTGVEIAGELGSYLNTTTNTTSPKVAITLITSTSRILPTLRPDIAATAEKYLINLGVTLCTNTKVEDYNARTKTVRLNNGDSMKDVDIYIPATGTKPNTSFLSPLLLAPDGRVLTNPATLRVDCAGARIYAVGDCSNAYHPAIHNILDSIPVLGENIKRDLSISYGGSGSGEGGDKCFKEDTRDTQLVPIGRIKGVGVIMGWKVPSWVVWVVKGRDYWVWTTGRVWSGRMW
jgi:NADH dehydrogenase FAD-containing subunit